MNRHAWLQKHPSPLATGGEFHWYPEVPAAGDRELRAGFVERVRGVEPPAVLWQLEHGRVAWGQVFSVTAPLDGRRYVGLVLSVVEGDRPVAELLAELAPPPAAPWTAAIATESPGRDLGVKELAAVTRATRGDVAGVVRALLSGGSANVDAPTSPELPPWIASIERVLPEPGARPRSGVWCCGGVGGASEVSGASGPSGVSGVSGASGPSGVSAANGPSGMSGVSGASGTGGASGVRSPGGVSGPSGASGPGGVSGPSGASGPTRSSDRVAELAAAAWREPASRAARGWTLLCELALARGESVDRVGAGLEVIDAGAVLTATERTEFTGGGSVVDVLHAWGRGRFDRSLDAGTLPARLADLVALRVIARLAAGDDASGAIAEARWYALLSAARRKALFAAVAQRTASLRVLVEAHHGRPTSAAAVLALEELDA